ncbi:unnamed protein product [Sphagnum jensenii]|uniref:Uncharacterized protein n=1 Tax=Sphagnum jensenii TaxID=128206 RepID=A0ABP0V5R2_9BRYO
MSEAERAEPIVVAMLFDNSHEEIPCGSIMSCTEIGHIEARNSMTGQLMKLQWISRSRKAKGHQGRLVKVRQSVSDVPPNIFKVPVLLTFNQH